MTDQPPSARFLWLLRPPVSIDRPTERIILLVGAAALFAGFDMNIFGLAIPQIQASFAIPENEIGLTVSYFRIAAIVALLLAASADIIGRRRLLLFTIIGQAIFTLLTAFAQNYEQFVAAQFLTRVFGYAEEMLCIVVIAEEIDARARGWANGALSGFNYFGAGLAALVFMAVNLLPYGWRAIYLIGAVPIFMVAYLRRSLPETQRFEIQQVKIAGSRIAESLALVRAMAREYPRRLFTVLVAAAAFGFAIAPASVLYSKYLQDTHGFTPAQVSMLIIPCGLVGLGLTIMAGRMSDRLGRRPMGIAILLLAAGGFALFYGGAPDWALAPLWIVAFFGFFAGEALIAGFALEIMPTRYRATVSGLRYLCAIGAGALALALEGVFFDRFGGHGPAIQVMLLAIPIAMAAIWALPEPAGKSLEEMTGT